MLGWACSICGGSSEIYNMGILCGNPKERGYLEDLEKMGIK
jgi:hypothetical protein